MELDLKKAQEFQLQFDRMEVDTIETAKKSAQVLQARLSKIDQMGWCKR